MLDLLTGRPGAGKSYEAVAFFILPALQAGRTVVTNMPLNVAEFAKLNPAYAPKIIIVHPSPDNLRPFSTIADYTRYQDLHSPEGLGVMYVIDESHMAIPAGNKNTPQDVREWYALHRHYVADVLIMTQSVRKLNKEILDMVRYHIQLSKNDALGLTGRYRRFTRDGVGGELTSKGSVIKYEKRFFPLYQTHTGKAGVETKSREKTIWSHWIFKYALPLVLVLVVWSFSRVDFGGFGKHKPVARPLAATSLTPSGPVVAPSVVASRASAAVADDAAFSYPFKGATFLISGMISLGKQKTWFITARQPDGRTVRMKLPDLLAAGYSVNEASDCFISLNYRLPSGKYDKNFATCGVLKDLPPIFYIDPTRQAGLASRGDGLLGSLGSGLSGTTPSPTVVPNYIAKPVPADVVPSVAVQSKALPPAGLRSDGIAPVLTPAVSR